MNYLKKIIPLYYPKSKVEFTTEMKQVIIRLTGTQFAAQYDIETHKDRLLNLAQKASDQNQELIIELRQYNQSLNPEEDYKTATRLITNLLKGITNCQFKEFN